MGDMGGVYSSASTSKFEHKLKSSGKEGRMTDMEDIERTWLPSDAVAHWRKLKAFKGLFTNTQYLFSQTSLRNTFISNETSYG